VMLLPSNYIVPHSYRVSTIIVMVEVLRGGLAFLSTEEAVLHGRHSSFSLFLHEAPFKNTQQVSNVKRRPIALEGDEAMTSDAARQVSSL